MTPTARRAIHELLEGVQASQAQRALSFLQEKALRGRWERRGPRGRRPRAHHARAGRHAGAGSAQGHCQGEGAEGPEPRLECLRVLRERQLQRGSPGLRPPPRQDVFAVGRVQGQVDELQQHMDKEEFEFEETKYNLNTQIEVTRNQKATCVSDFNQAVADIAAAKEEMSQKEEEARDLDHDYQVYMEACRKRIYWIKYQDYCSYVLVRALTMKYSTVSPPEKIVDCGVTDWVPGDCSVSCDDECPDPTDPYGCGGWQTLARE